MRLHPFLHWYTTFYFGLSGGIPVNHSVCPTAHGRALENSAQLGEPDHSQRYRWRRRGTKSHLIGGGEHSSQ